MSDDSTGLLASPAPGRVVLGGDGPRPRTRRFVFVAIGAALVLALVGAVALVVALANGGGIDGDDGGADAAAIPPPPPPPPGPAPPPSGQRVLTMDDVLSGAFAAHSVGPSAAGGGNGAWLRGGRGFLRVVGGRDNATTVEAEVVRLPQSAGENWTAEVVLRVTAEVEAAVAALFSPDVAVAASWSTLRFVDADGGGGGGGEMLVAVAREKLWRHSFFAHYVVLNVSKVPTEPGFARNLTTDASLGVKMADVRLSPGPIPAAGSDRPVAVVVHENDVYLQSLDEGSAAARITWDGTPGGFSVDEPNGVQNGVMPWVYEEEIFADTRAVWWSPSSTHFVFLKSNNTDVPLINYPFYAARGDDPLSAEHAGAAYPQQMRVRYPTAGYPNPRVSLQLVEPLSSTVIRVPLESANVPAGFTMEYVTGVHWVPPVSGAAAGSQRLAVQLMNRDQTEMRVALFSVAPVQMGSIPTFQHAITVTAESGQGWLDMAPLVPLCCSGGAAGASVATILPRQGFRHVARFDLDAGAGASPQFLTSGPFDVMSIAGYTGPGDDTLVYIAAAPTALDRAVRAVRNASTVAATTPPAASVSVSPPGDAAYWSVIMPSPSEPLPPVTPGGATASSFAPLSYGGPDLPYQVVTDVRSEWGSAATVPLSDNEALRARLATLSLPRRRYTEIFVRADGGAARAADRADPGVLTLNAVVDEAPVGSGGSGKKDAPLLLDVYGGPGSQRVTRRWSSPGFNTLLASAHGFTIASVDGRGTGARGKHWEAAVYKHLGEYEVRDQRSAAAAFRRTDSLFRADEPAARPSGVAIWGWSYGGFVTSSVAAGQQSTHVPESAGGSFDCVAAVAPVTDWRLYDSCYTERFMLTPQQNPEGYTNTSILRAAHDKDQPFLDDGRYLLAHGMADDNVHFTNAAELAIQLQEQNIQFDMITVPNRDHGIAGNARRFLYTALERFFVKHLV